MVLKLDVHIMLSPKVLKRYALTNIYCTDAAAYTFQTNSLLLALLVWRLRGRRGDVMDTRTGKSALLLHDESFRQK